MAFVSHRAYFITVKEATRRSWIGVDSTLWSYSVIGLPTRTFVQSKPLRNKNVVKETNEDITSEGLRGVRLRKTTRHQKIEIGSRAYSPEVTLANIVHGNCSKYLPSATPINSRRFTSRLGVSPYRGGSPRAAVSMHDGNIHAKHLWVPLANGLLTTAAFHTDDGPPDRSSPAVFSVVMDTKARQRIRKPSTP